MIKHLIFLLSFLAMMVCVHGQNLKPTNEQALVTVKVFNSDASPLPEQAVFIKNLQTQKAKKGISDETGQFQILLPKGTAYSMYFPEYKENADEQSLSIPAKEGLFNIEMKIFKPKITYKEKYVLNVLYETGKAKLLSNSYPYLDSLYNKLKANPDLEIEIAGHTDNVGSDAFNLQLSQQRAANVKSYLVKKGISSSRIAAKGYGELEPVADNSTEAGRQRNRRTEVRVTSK